MAACGLERQPSKDFAYQAEDDSTIITANQTVIQCFCKKVKIELCKPVPLGASVSVKTEDRNGRKFCSKQDGYGGDDEKEKENLSVQNYVYFGNELKILQGDDNVRFSIMDEFKKTNDYIRLFSSCCHTIMLGYSKKFLGWEGRRVAYLYKKSLYKGQEVPKPACITWKKMTPFSNKDLSKLTKSLGLTAREQFNVGSIDGKGKRKPAADWNRYRKAIGIIDGSSKLQDPEVKEEGDKGLSFMKLMEVQFDTLGDKEPDVWKTKGMKK